MNESDRSHPELVLEVRGVSSTYRLHGERLPVLDSISFGVEAGSFVTVIGPSGSGKSTLLNIIAGLSMEDAGDIALGGDSLPAGERLGWSSYMHQRDLLLPWRTVVANAALGLEVRGAPRRTARVHAESRLPEFGLAGFGDAYPAQLSGGMRQRAALLRTMLMERALLLLDEPFGALDALTRIGMQEMLLGLFERSGPAVVLVTHDVEEAVYLSDRVIVLSNRPGRITHVEAISLPRPRVRAMVTGQPFLNHKSALLGMLGALPAEATSR